MAILGSYAFSIMKAMSTTCVKSNEIGKINAVLSAVESLLPTGVIYVYTKIWEVIRFKEMSIELRN